MATNFLTCGRMALLMTVAMLTVTSLSGVRAFAGNVGCGVPGKAGDVEVSLDPGGGIPPQSVTVHIDPATENTAAKKAAKIAQRLSDNGYAAVCPVGGTKITVAGHTCSVVSDGTNEKITATSLYVPTDSVFASLTFAGGVSAISTRDGESYFQGEFGINDVPLTQATVPYSSLSDPTVDGMLTTMYDGLLSNLPASLQSGLSLDLASDRITFAFPSGSGEFYAASDTNSLTTMQSVTMNASAVPEPSTALIGIGAILVRLAARRPSARRVN